MGMLRFWRNTGGSVALETALTLLVTVPFVFSIFEVCMVSFTYSTLNDSVRQGVRYAVSHGTGSTNCSGPSAGCADATGANVQAVVQQEARLSAHNLSGMTISVTYPDSASTPTSRVLVAVAYPYVPFVSYPWFQQTLHLSAEGRIVY
jgi:Flp pilus assembly protein TadG